MRKQPTKEHLEPFGFCVKITLVRARLVFQLGLNLNFLSPGSAWASREPFFNHSLRHRTTGEPPEEP